MSEFDIRKPVFWLAAGLLIGLAIQTSQARYTGNWTGLVAAGLAVFVTVRRGRGIWPFLIVPWVLLALVSSHWIWDLGNNSIRSFAPLLTFALFALVEPAAQPSNSLRNLPV